MMLHTHEVKVYQTGILIGSKSQRKQENLNNSFRSSLLQRVNALVGLSVNSLGYLPIKRNIRGT